MNNATESTATTVSPGDISYIICFDARPVPPEYINYGCIPMLVIVILLSFLVKRKRLWPGCCHERPGILIPMNLIQGKNSREALSAAFAILTSRLMRLLLDGDSYWLFPGMDNPALSFLKVIVKICNSVQLSMCFYPLFVCIEHHRYIFMNILGYLALSPWFYFTMRVIWICSEAPILEAADLYVLLIMQLPELIAHFYLIWFFTKTLAINILRKRHCKVGSSSNLTEDSSKDAVYMVYVRALLQRKERKVTGVVANVKEYLTYRKIPGLRASPRILITLTVSVLAVYSLTWYVFRFANSFEPWLKSQVSAVGQEMGIDPTDAVENEILRDYIIAVAYGAYACSFLALVCELVSIWRVYVNYRKSVRQMLRGDKTIYKEIKMTPANLVVYASKYPGFQIAFTVYGYAVTFIVLYIVFVVIFTYLLILPLKWGFTSLVWELIKWNWQTVLLSLMIYHIQLLFAKRVFFDRETGIYDNRRLFAVTDYYLFFFNALLSLFTSLKRIVLALVFGVFYLSRLDQCGMLRGFERFDNGHKAFIAMLHVEVTQNNPIVLSFIELLSRGATNRHEVSHSLSKTALHEAEVGELTTMEDPKSRRHRWAINQWLKAYTLLNNRSLIQEQVSKKALENLRVEDVEEKDDGEEEK